jgi:intermediate peptidase
MFQLWMKQVVASYFPVGQCIEALRIMCHSLFGVTFEQEPLAPGEAWHPAVQKMSLRHSSEVFLCMTSIS